MKKNVGTIDRIVRLILAIIIVVLYYFGIFSGLTAIILGVVAVIFLLTGFIRFCPLYIPLKINTMKKK